MMYKALEISDKDVAVQNVNFPNKTKAEMNKNAERKNESSKLNEIDNLLAELNS